MSDSAINQETCLYGGTPEQLFIINPKTPKEIDIDVMSCAISRAQGICNLISSNGESGRFYSSPETIINGLWAINGILKQIEQMVDYSTSEVKS